MRKHNYVAGFRGENRSVYGKRVTYGKKANGMYNSIGLLTLKQAQQLAKKIVSIGSKSKSVVYKLVEVK